MNDIPRPGQLIRFTGDPADMRYVKLRDVMCPRCKVPRDADVSGDLLTYWCPRCHVSQSMPKNFALL